MALEVLQTTGVLFLGWIGGILVNTLADVLPISRRLSTPVCSNCGAKQLSWRYLVFPKACTACNAKRTLRVWLVEVIFIFASYYLWSSPAPRLPYLASMLVILYLGLVAVIDIEHRLILHPVSLGGALIGVVIGVWLHGPLNTLIGGLLGFGVMLALYGIGLAYVRVRYGSIQEADAGIAPVAYGDALGFGDVNLGGVLGLLAGWPTIILALVLAIILAGVVSLFMVFLMIVQRKYRSDFAIPYGPFLISGAILVLFFGDLIRAVLG